MSDAVWNGPGAPAAPLNLAWKNDVCEVMPFWAAGADGTRPVPVVWLHVLTTSDGAVLQQLVKTPCVLLCVFGPAWNRDFTPWLAPPLRVGDAPFAGQAEEYRTFFLTRLVPEAETRLPFAAQTRALAGYSLAGLFAADTVCRTDAFARAASVSGSLWYDDWAQWAAEHPPAAERRVYLSLGDREQRANNARIAAVQRCTDAVAAAWSGVCPVQQAVNSGGHFAHPEQRMADAIDTLLAME